MTIKTKIIIGIVVVVIAISIGLFFMVQDFTSIQQDQRDSISDKTEEKTKKQDPILELTQEEVVLEVGSTFSYQDFIKKAEDENGYNLKDTIQSPGDISTEKPGEYQIEYTLELSNGKKISKQLLLKIAEFDLGTNSD